METNASTSKHQVGTMRLENTKVRSVVENLSCLIETCISSEDNKLKCLSIVDYNQEMIILRKKGMKHTNDEIKKSIQD